MLGLFTRLIAIPMIINMLIAIVLVVIKNVGGIDAFVELNEVVYILLFFGLLMAGPGKVSLDALTRVLAQHRAAARPSAARQSTGHDALTR